MNRDLTSSLKVDREAFSVASLTDESGEKAYWLARTPQERLQQVELLRRINYGTKSAARIEKVIEIVDREQS
jgi:hypothetical protein